MTGGKVKMTGIGAGVQLDRSDLERLMGKKGIKYDPMRKGEKGEKKEKNRSRRILDAVLILITFVYYAVMLFGRFILPEGNEIYQGLDLFYQGDDYNGLARLASYAVVTYSVSKLIRFLIERVGKNSRLTKRTGVAVMELLGNLVKYLAVLILVFLFLTALGVDTGSLLAGLGILSLILGLGVTSLVEDVVAGIFIIAEHLFDVGDIVVVDDFRGTIISIGIRSTQIEDEGGDILVLRNSSIESLVNMTNRLSYAICEIPIDAEESIERVEKILETGLTKMKEKINEIEHGPFYLGISEMHAEGVTLTFVAICQENAKYWIQRQMNREIKLLFDKNHVNLGEFAEDEG